MRRILSIVSILLLCAGAMCLALSLGSVTPPHFKSAHAQVPMTGAGLGAPSSGGSPPTWTPTDAELNETCGFVTTCNITVTVNAGFQVIGIAGDVNASVVSVSLCSTSIPTEVVTTGVIGAFYEASIWTGTVACSGSQTLAITGGANDLRFVYAGLGVLANLSSTTATHTCSNSAAPTASSTLACSSGFTVPSNGYAIAWTYQSFASAMTFASPITTDEATTGASGAAALGNSSAAGSLTPTANVFNGAGGAGIAAATWH